jgi:hypothetical protein
MQIYINPRLEFKLRETSKKTDVPMSQILATALENYLGTEIKMAYDPDKKELQGLPIKDLLKTIDEPVSVYKQALKSCCDVKPDPVTRPKFCQHWVRDEGGYTNMRTGETVEV